MAVRTKLANQDSMMESGPPFWVVNISARSLNPDAEYGRDGWVVRKLRGGKCRTVSAMMSEAGAALQFFDGFGENWHALGECLSYLDEWLPADGYVLVIEHAEHFLADEPTEVLWFVRTIEEVGGWWAQAISDNDRFNRPARAFRVVLELPAEASAPVWRALCDEGVCWHTWQRDVAERGGF